MALILFLGLNNTFSQVGIGTTNPDPSSMLDVVSVTQGLLLPRMTFAERDAIASPATGLLVYCTNDNHFYVNKGTAVSPSWVMMSTQWLRTGSDIWYSTGKVGIGATPVWLFDVAGDINFTGILRKNGTPVATGVSAVTATAPLLCTGGANPNISIPPANGTNSGYLSSADWNTFNNKQNALILGNVTSGDMAITGGSGAVIGPGLGLTINKGNLLSPDMIIAGGTNAVLGGGANMIIKKNNLTETTSSVLNILGGANSVLGTGTSIEVKQAGAFQPGYLSSADWTTFNNKISSQWITSGPNIYYTPGSVGIGATAPATNLHISENNGDVNPSLQVEQMGTGDASMQFKQNFNSVSEGIHYTDNLSYKICSSPALIGQTYNAPDQLFRIQTIALKKGITDINHQSRVRAYMNASPAIQSGIWTPLAFQQVSYDEHNEFTPMQQYFVALQEGYYQVNARVEFQVIAPVGNVNGYVSIAVYKNNGMYAQGNNLQIGDKVGAAMPFNNAPNVSDVLFLSAGDMVDIRVFQNYSIPPATLQLLPAIAKTYFSIHKIS